MRRRCEIRESTRGAKETAAALPSFSDKTSAPAGGDKQPPPSPTPQPPRRAGRARQKEATQTGAATIPGFSEEGGGGSRGAAVWLQSATFCSFSTSSSVFLSALQVDFFFLLQSLAFCVCLTKKINSPLYPKATGRTCRAEDGDGGRGGGEGSVQFS